MTKSLSQAIICPECRIPLWRMVKRGNTEYACTRCGLVTTLVEVSKKPLPEQAPYIQPALRPIDNDVSFSDELSH